ncbi:MAG: hypothetical protein N3E51_04825 [Candidatus Micrarchaeota archaeon]|nr:hypothetical protein [Candidatus Micrarchaeota archaeon]
MKQYLMVALVCAILLFGCTGSMPEQQSPQGQPQSKSQVQQSPSQNQGAGAATSSGTSENQPAKKRSEFKAFYDLYNEPSRGMGVSKMAIYQKGSTKQRMDSEFEGIESRIYILDKFFYACTKQGGSWTCIKMETKPESPDPLDKAMEGGDDFRLVPDGTMQIAGATATCYKVEGDKKTIQYGRFCLSPEGVPLYEKVVTSGPSGTFTTELKATGYSTTVSESDFELPASPTSMPSYGGYGAQTPPNIGGSGAPTGSGSWEEGSEGGETQGKGPKDCGICQMIAPDNLQECLKNCEGSP